MVALVIRADGGPEIGAGHLGRCLALAQAWRARGGDVTLVSDRPPPLWVQRFQGEDAVVREPSPGWTEISAGWAVVDGYSMAAAEAELRGAGHRILAIDDFGFGGPHAADLVLDQNLDVKPATYGGPALLGPHYALLRREFRRRVLRRNVPAHAEKLLLAIGGFPMHAVTSLVESSAARAKGPFTVERLQGSQDVAPAMAAADIAVATAGTTVWELCCAGVAAVLMSSTPNQRPVAAAVAARGLADDAGPVAELTADVLATRLDTLAADRDRREAMIAGAQQLVDGRGASRVVTRLLADLLMLRPASADDGRLLWAWANDPEVRERAFSTDPIPWDTHVAWLADRLADPDAHIWVASDSEGELVGQVRFETRDGTTEIAVTVASAARGRGWGAALIDAGVRRLFSETDVDRVVARVKPDNEPSIRAFESAVFDFEGEGSDEHNMWVRYARRRDASGR